MIMWPKGKPCPSEVREKIAAAFRNKPKRKAPCHPERAYFAKDMCKQCYERIVDAARGQTTVRRDERRAYSANSYRWKTVGVTPQEYDEQFKRQGGKCALCSNPPGKRALCLDHDHETNKPRGLLCDTCNWALGLFRESPEILLRAIDYLASPPWGK